MIYHVSCFICFFKQKTAYEMLISDWSSDVCASDLQRTGAESRVEADLDQLVLRGIRDLHRHVAVEQTLAEALGEQAHDLAELILVQLREDDDVVDRSGGRRVGKEWVRTGRSRWSRDVEKKKKQIK